MQIGVETELNKQPSVLQFPVPTLSERNRLIELSHRARGFRSEFAVASKGIDKLFDATTQRADRISDTLDDIEDDISTLVSSITVGTAYLKMSAELSARGVSEVESLYFFRRCLHISVVVGHAILEQSGPVEDRRHASIYTSIDSAQILLQEVDKETKSQPTWFNGDRQEWRRFLAYHSHLHEYLAPGSKSSPSVYGEIDNEGLPDWFTETTDQLPDKTVIQQEIDDDQLEVANTTEQQNKLAKQQAYLLQTVHQKYIRALARFEIKRRSLQSNISSYADLIYYLKTAEEITAYPELDLTVLQNHTDIGYPFKFTVSAEKAREQTLQESAKSKAIVFSKEIVAFWLEKQLKDGNIISDSEFFVNQKFIDRITPLLSLGNFEDKGTNRALNELKSSSKKAYNVLNFEVGPIFSTLSQEQLDDINVWVSENIGKSMNDVIWYIADVISDKLLNHGENLPSQTKIAIDHIKDFAIKWLRNNCNWAYGQLESLTRYNTSEAVQQPSSQEFPLTLPTTKTADQETIDEVENATQEIQQSNLSGWHIKYTFNKKVDGSTVEIVGSTLKELEEYFHKFVATNNISCSIKPESIIHTLDWLVTVPQLAEDMRIRKMVNGQEFKKVKRGRVRIFYVLNSDKKDIVFFVHQKQALSYGF